MEKMGTLAECFVICMVDMTLVSGWYEDNDTICLDDKEPAPLRSPVNNEDMINMIKAAYKHGTCFLTAEELKELRKNPKAPRKLSDGESTMMLKTQLKLCLL